MYCQKCGKELPGGAAFCPSCGQKVSGAAASNHSGPAQQNGGWTANPGGGQKPQYTAQSYHSGTNANTNGGQNHYTRPAGTRRKGGCLRVVLIVLLIMVVFHFASQLFGSLFGGGYDYDNGDTTAIGSDSVELDIDDLRDRYTTIKGNGDDVFTVMVYMIGSDLESSAGMATNDLSEMYYSGITGNVNLIVQTGGCSQWHVRGIDANKIQRWQVTSDGIGLVDEMNLTSMVEPETLTDFIEFCEENYPANRYGLILWDHGGGTMYGYGSDEYYDGSLMLSDIDTALTDAGVKFDFVGYDACLMATIENASMLEKHADYLIASEELEPGEGWKYDGWLPELCQNTSIETVELGKLIVDSFVATSGSDNTLSVTELREIPYTYQQLSDYLDSARVEIESNNIRTIATARSGARSYNSGQVEMVDIVDLVQRAELDGAEDVVAAVKSCVKYRNNCTVSGSNGLSMYYPYASIDYYSSTRRELVNVGVSQKPLDFFDEFVSVLAGSRSSVDGARTVAQSLGGTVAAPSDETETDYADEEWYNSDTVSQYQSYYDESTYTEREVVWNDEYDAYVLSLTEDEWKNINLDAVTLEALVQMDYGYIDLGSDQSIELAGNDLLITFDGEWVAIEGQVVPFYTESAENSVFIEGVSSDDDEWYSCGYVPAELTRNGERCEIELILRWDNDHPSGYCAGYRLADGTDETQARGYLQLKVGDKLDFIADFYSDNGNYDGTSVWGSSLTITEDMVKSTGSYSSDGIFEDALQPIESALEIGYAPIGDYSVLVQFCLTDLCQNTFYTEPVVFD